MSANQLTTRKAQLVARLDKLKSQFDNATKELNGIDEKIAAAALADVVNSGLPAGSNVTFTYGRDKTKKNLSGVVLGSKPIAGRNAVLYRIAVGSGFDCETYSVQSASILTHDFVAPTADVDPLDGVTTEQSDDITFYPVEGGEE